MTDARWYLICYDIHDPARLRRAAKVLEGTGQRMQWSVFRCWLTPSALQELRWRLTQVLDPADDVLIIPLCARCVAGMATTHSARNVPSWPDSPESHRIL